ncbi:MAG TPA: hypothetical protein VEL31_24735, partial [Ktedonobacteraceae bacterium]|nr:hypothetical protein [Ktedonobacteraceae bacterium]
LQTIIDQRFYPRTYDAEQVLAPFKATLRAVVDPDQLGEKHITGEQWEQEGDVTMVVLSRDASSAG